MEIYNIDTRQQDRPEEKFLREDYENLLPTNTPTPIKRGTHISFMTYNFWSNSDSQKLTSIIHPLA